jgi:hypothetical protein
MLYCGDPWGITMSRLRSTVVAAAVLAALAAPLRAQGIAEPQSQSSATELQPHWQYSDRPPQFGDPRFAFRRSDDGYRRIDISTGEVASCRKGAAGWDCVAVPGERVTIDAEMARLQRENALLKKMLTEHGLPLPDGVAPAPAERTSPVSSPASPPPAAAEPQAAAIPAVPATPSAPPSPFGEEPPRPPETVPPATTASIPVPPVASHPVPPETIPPTPRSPATGDQASRNDSEIDRIMQVMEKAWRRLVDMMAAIQRDMRKS